MVHIVVNSNNRLLAKHYVGLHIVLMLIDDNIVEHLDFFFLYNSCFCHL